MLRMRHITITSDNDITHLPIELECELSQLALAWTTKNPNISSIILGPRTPGRLLEGVKALEVVPKLTCEMMARIEDVLGSWPGSGSPK